MIVALGSSFLVASCDDSKNTLTDETFSDSTERNTQDADTLAIGDENALIPDEEDVPDADFTVIEGDLACGESDMFWIYDLSTMPPKNVQICAHVRAESDHVRVLVADEAWGTRVNADKVRTILTAWEIATPADSKRGIFEVATDLFGPVPNEFDDYPGLYLFLYEMAGYNGNSFDGYFRVDDQYDGDYSNRREMIHINVAEGKDPTSAYMLSVQAHEFQHLIHWGRDESEEAWFNEAMSELAMVVTGFAMDELWVNSWLATPSEPLLANGPSYDYGVLLLFGTYLYDRFGAGFITNLVADKKNGTAAIDGMLSALPTPLTFPDLAADFALAVLVQDAHYDDGRFGFTSIAPSRKAASKLVEESAQGNANANGGMVFFRIENYDPAYAPTVTLAGNGALSGRVAYLDTDGAIVATDAFSLDDENPSASFSCDSAGVASAQIALINLGSEKASVSVMIP